MNITNHATVEQLIEIKDGLDNQASTHVASCSHCQSEIVRLELIAEQMRSSAECQPPAHLWSRIEAAVATDSDDADSINTLAANNVIQQSAGAGSLNKAIYTLAASIMFTGMVGLFIFGQQGTNQQQNAIMQASIQQLMSNSRGMELTLQKVALQNELLTTSEQSTVDRLYWRIALLDQRIHENTESSRANPEVLETLWNDRVDTLNELNQLYYQRQQTLAQSEI